MDLSRCHQLARYSWPRRSARRALPGKMCRRRLDWRAGGGLASPPTGCSCRRCRGSSRAQRAAASVGRSVPPPPGDSRRRRQRCLGVSYCVAACAQFVCPFSSNCSTVSVSASMKHHLQLHYRLVKFILLVPACSVLVAPPPCKACAAGQGVPPPGPPPLCALLGVASPPTGQVVQLQPPCDACQRRRGARRAIHPLGQGVPQPQGDSRHQRHRSRCALPPASPAASLSAR